MKQIFNPLINLKLENGKYYFRMQLNGRRVKRKLDTIDYEEAKKLGTHIAAEEFGIDAYIPKDFIPSIESMEQFIHCPYMWELNKRSIEYLESETMRSYMATAWRSNGTVEHSITDFKYYLDELEKLGQYAFKSRIKESAIASYATASKRFSRWRHKIVDIGETINMYGIKTYIDVKFRNKNGFTYLIFRYDKHILNSAELRSGLGFEILRHYIKNRNEHNSEIYIINNGIVFNPPKAITNENISSTIAHLTRIMRDNIIFRRTGPWCLDCMHKGVCSGTSIR